MTETLADPWDIAARWQEFEGETRANLLRVGGIAAFYAVELWNRANVTPEFHHQVTRLAAAWVLAAFAVHMSLRRRFFPRALKYVVTAADVVLFTSLLLVADGPASPLVAGYFLLLSVAALRFSLRLLRFSALACVASYLLVAQQAARLRPALAVPRVHELIVLVSLALVGVTLGQLLRRARALAEDYSARSGGPR